jgi:hypothetical protein
VNKRLLVVAGTLIGCWLFLSVSFSLGKKLAQPAALNQGWTTVFTETFTTKLSLWTFTETTSTGYQWGVVP